MPDTSAKGGDVNLARVFGIGCNAVTPFEVVAGDACPMFASVMGDPGRRLETGCVKHIGILRIDSDVVDVTIAVENPTPRAPSINR